MALVLGMALAILCLGVVAYPFLMGKRVSPDSQDLALELEQKRQTVYQEAKLLHNDYMLGDVTEADYVERLQMLRMEAARLLYHQERLQELDRRLEVEIAHLRTDTAEEH